MELKEFLVTYKELDGTRAQQFFVFANDEADARARAYGSLGEDSQILAVEEY